MGDGVGVGPGRGVWVGDGSTVGVLAGEGVNVGVEVDVGGKEVGVIVGVEVSVGMGVLKRASLSRVTFGSGSAGLKGLPHARMGNNNRMNVR